jgi:hypothetical protein
MKGHGSESQAVRQAEVASLRRCAERLEASAARMMLPGLMHRVRNLLFQASGHLTQVAEALPGTDLEPCSSALDQMRDLLDLLAGGRAGDHSPLWLESGSLTLGRMEPFLSYALRDEGLALDMQVGEELPGLAVPPASALRWMLCCAQHLLAQVPDGVRGIMRVRCRESEGAIRCVLRFATAPGFLPLVLRRRPVDQQLRRLASTQGYRIDSGFVPVPWIRLAIPGRR